MKVFSKFVVFIICALTVSGLNIGSQAYVIEGTKGNTELVIFHAGSLSVPFRLISELFEKEHPGVKVLPEPAGSRDTARKVSDLGRRCDVLGSADHVVIDNLLKPEHVGFNIRFAGNEMALAYSARSRFADEISAENWSGILLRKDVAVGRADPNRDPCGYRTVMMFQLAEEFYGDPGLAEKLTTKHEKKYIRPKETDLLALLEVGEIDYLPIYSSVAIQHGLKHIDLPQEIDLGSNRFADIYAMSAVELTGSQPGEFITRNGAPMVYGVTIPNNCEQQELAEAWIALLLSPEGQAIMAECGQPPISPAQTTDYGRLPQSLKPYCTPIESSQ